SGTLPTGGEPSSASDGHGSGVAAIWAEVLHRPEVGITDNLFDLGGHSLIALRILNQVRQRLGREISLAALFLKPTVEQLAALIDGESIDPESDRPLVAIKPEGSRVPFFCVHALGGEVYSYLPLAAYLDPEQPFYGLRARQPDDSQGEVTVESLASEYIQE